MKSKRELLIKSFVQRVSSPTTFNKRYKMVCQLLDSKPVLTQQQWIYMWRGLYYSIWYTEMGKGCELLAQKIASNRDIDMIYAGFKALANDWFGIDFFRIDKYMYLVRLMINNVIHLQLNNLIVSDHKTDHSIDQTVSKSDENGETDEEIPTLIPIDDELPEDVNQSDDESKNKIKEKTSKNKFRNKSKKFGGNKKLAKVDLKLKFNFKINAIFIDNILNRIKSSLGLILHISDIYVEELSKVLKEPTIQFSDIHVKSNVIVDMFVPFIKILATINDNRITQSIKEEVFDKFKTQLIIGESIELRKTVINKLIDAMFSYGSDERVIKRNRAVIYNLIRLYKIKYELLSSEDVKHVRKRKIVEKIGKRKIVKYESTTNSPFVRSIVPIAVL